MGRGRGGSITVVLDDGSTLEIDTQTLNEYGLYTGIALSPRQISELKNRSIYFSCLNAAMHFLSHRERSKKEVTVKLRQRGFSHETIQAVIAKLEEKQLVNDVEFARTWTDNRRTFHPKSRLLIIRELKQKGISGDIIENVVADLDDNESAFQAGLKKSRLLRALPRDEFSLKLSRYLQGKGFSYSVAEHAVERLWQNRKLGY